MNFPWVICLASEDAASMAGLRLTSGIEVAEADGKIWLRGPAAGETIATALQRLPALARYEVKGNRLRDLGCCIPSQVLPSLTWQGLKTWIKVERPGRRDAGAPSVSTVEPLGAPASRRPARVRLVRSTEEREPTLLLTSLEDWHEFTISAPEVRLQPLRFAVNEEARVLVQGEPLPPLPGPRFVVEGNVAAPAGFTWQPAVGSAVLARLLGARDQELALLYEDGTCCRVQTEQFVVASRAAVRATVAEFEENERER